MKELIKKYYSAGGIIANYDKDEWKYLALLQKRNNSELQWVSPKGQLEKEETSQMAAIREIDEETGLKDITLITSLGSQVFSFPLEDMKCEKVVDWYLFRSNNPTELLLNEEEGFIEARWLNYLEARNIFTHPSFIPFLEKGYHFLIKKT